MKKILLIVLGVVIVLSGAYVTYANRSKLFTEKPTGNTAVSTNRNLNLNENANSNQNSNSNKVTVTPVVDPGVTWIEPERLSDLGLFGQKDSDCDFAQMEYYKTANLSTGGTIILAKTSCGLGGNYFFTFKKDSDGKYYYLLNNNDNSVFSNAPDNYLADYGTKTYLDGSTTYASILPPSAISVDNGVTLKKAATIGSGSYGFFSDLKNATKVGESNYGPIYEVLDNTANPIANRSFALKLSDTTVVSYNLNIPFLLDDNVPDVTINGTKNASKYIKSLVAACGYRSNVSVLGKASDLSSRLISAGTTSTGETIYYPKDQSDVIVGAAYTFYSTNRDNAVSREDFFNQKPIFFWRDPFGAYVTFLKEDFAPLAECGKPVVYLYPEKTMSVSVEVDADITKSEPSYGAGWNVVANPTGVLDLKGKKYDSLYWEGQGSGAYPEVKSGFIVKKEDIKTTLVDHLTKLGLNTKERTDFLEFWLPKMPSAPYVRLTWFGTRQMNELAPLKINPKPDTVIRVFLDFEGLNAPIEIDPQKLTKS